MSNERQSWEDGLNNLIHRAELRNQEAQTEIDYLKRLERFIDVSRELRETFRTYVLRESPPPIPNHEDASHIAPRFAPRLPAEEFTDSIFDDMRRGVN